MVTFRGEVKPFEYGEGTKAHCRRCGTTSIYYEKGYNEGGAMGAHWLTASEYSEIYIPPEATVKVEDVYKELHLERRVKDKKTGTVSTVPEVQVLINHAPWCGSPDVPIAGLTAKIGGPGRIRWRDRKGVIRHNCVSSAAGRKHAEFSNAVQGHTGKTTAQPSR